MQLPTLASQHKVKPAAIETFDFKMEKMKNHQLQVTYLLVDDKQKSYEQSVGF